MDVQRKLAAVGLAVGLFAGGAAGVVLSNSGVSAAAPGVLTQDDSTEAPTEDGDDSERDCRRGPGGAHTGGEVAADALGITAEELHEALRDGATIAEVAALQGVEVQVVIDAMVAEAEAHLAEKVAEGDLTQAEADERLAEVTERVSDSVQNGRPDGQEGPHGRRGFGPPRGSDAPEAGPGAGES